MEIVHDSKWHRFTLMTEKGAQAGYIEYEPVKRGVIRAVSTQVYPEYEGKGYATMLLDALTEYADKKGIRIVAECSFVKDAFDTNSEKYAAVIGR